MALNHQNQIFDDKIFYKIKSGWRYQTVIATHPIFRSGSIDFRQNEFRWKFAWIFVLEFQDSSLFDGLRSAKTQKNCL